MTLLAKLMVLHRQILFSLAIAVIAETIRIGTSAEQVPSLHRVAPRYLKLVTFSNFWPFKLISALMLLVLLVMILLFFRADLHSICRCSVYESVGEILKFTVAVTFMGKLTVLSTLHKHLQL